MATERVVLVGIVWTLLLLGLLILREFLRAGRPPATRRMLPVVNALVVAMLGAFTLAAVLRLASLASPPEARASGLPTPSGLVAGLTPTPRPTPFRPTASPSGTPPIETPVPTSPVETPVPSAASTPASSPVPTTQRTPDPGFGEVSLPQMFTSYDVRDGRVAGFSDVQVAAPFMARSTAPATLAFPSLSRPTGTIRLVRVVSGRYSGVWVSPDDPGVVFTPA